MCELIVLNDTPGQPLKDAPYANVHVMNFESRFPTLGDKCNYGIKVASGKYVTRWDDDDISLPNRLKTVMPIVQRGDLDVLVVQGYFFHDAGPNKWEVLTGKYGFQQDIYRREIAMKVQYDASSNGEDQRFRAAMLSSPLTSRKGEFYPCPDELSYIYRWGVSPIHLSDSIENREARYQHIGSQPVIQLESPYVLEPHWRKDYVQITKNLLNKAKPDDHVRDKPDDQQ